MTRTELTTAIADAANRRSYYGAQVEYNQAQADHWELEVAWMEAELDRLERQEAEEWLSEALTMDAQPGVRQQVLGWVARVRRAA